MKKSLFVKYLNWFIMLEAIGMFISIVGSLYFGGLAKTIEMMIGISIFYVFIMAWVKLGRIFLLCHFLCLGILLLIEKNLLTL